MVFTTQLGYYTDAQLHPATKPESALGKLGDVAGEIAFAPVVGLVLADYAATAAVTSMDTSKGFGKFALDALLKLDGCNADASACKQI